MSHGAGAGISLADWLICAMLLEGKSVRTAMMTVAMTIFLTTVAAAQNFCSVSNNGREDCRFYTLAACNDHVRALGAFCVYRPSSAPSARAPTADIYGSFQRGVEDAQRRRFEQDSRELEIERQRLENDRLGQSMPAPPPKPYEQSSFSGLAQAFAVLRSASARNRILAPIEPNEFVTAADIERCEPIRVSINQMRMARTQADLAQISALDEVIEESPYSNCVYQMPPETSSR